MFYTLAVLFFGIYLGQEYPQIPNVKITFQIMVANLNKMGENENVVETNRNVENEEQRQGNENIEMKYFPVRKGYYSLPIWVTNWWSSSSTTSSDFEEEQQEVKEKSE